MRVGAQLAPLVRARRKQRPATVVVAVIRRVSVTAAAAAAAAVRVEEVVVRGVGENHRPDKHEPGDAQRHQQLRPPGPQRVVGRRVAHLD